jgi:hypothetical protein
MTIKERNTQVAEVASMLRKQLNPNTNSKKRILEMMGVSFSDSTGFEPTIKEDETNQSETFNLTASLNLEVKSQPINNANPLIYEVVSVDGDTNIPNTLALVVSVHRHEGKAVDAVLLSQLRGVGTIAEIDPSDLPQTQLPEIKAY